jgi:hypothetical protein
MGLHRTTLIIVCMRIRGKDKGFFSAAQRLYRLLGPAQLPIQWIPGTLPGGESGREREADHSSPSSAEIKNGGAIPPLSYAS